MSPEMDREPNHEPSFFYGPQKDGNGALFRYILERVDRFEESVEEKMSDWGTM